MSFEEDMLKHHIHALEDILQKNKALVRSSLYRMTPLDQPPTLEEVRELRRMMADIQGLSWCLREDIERVSTKRKLRDRYRKK